MGYTVDNFAEIATTTLTNYIESTLRDNIFQSDPVYAYLKSKGAMRMDGGDPLRRPLMYAKGTAGGSFNGYDLLDTDPQTGFGFAYYQWKQNYVPVTIDNRSLNINSGRSAVINLLEAKIMQAEETLIDYMTTQLYSDGTGNGSKDITGLSAMISPSGTYAGIDRSSYSWWQAQSETTSEAISKSNVRTMIHDIHGAGPTKSSDPTGRTNNKDKKGVCDLIVMTQTLYEAFEDLYEPHVRIQAGEGSLFAELGFEGMRFKGADITWSDNMTSGEVYFMSTQYIDFITHENVDFKNSPFQTPVNQDAMVSHIFWMGELTATNCRRLGEMTNKTA